ncbi:MAG: DUF1761 domain-containing protein [Planctomycetota bacterium]|nr:DUF1761 domain-containing protein [Planctomycetota bacterium]
MKIRTQATTGRYVLAVISYFVITMAIAYPWHMIWFHDEYVQMKAFTRAEPIIPLGMLAILIQGVVMAYFYPLFYRGGRPLIQGIKFGLLIGLMVYSVMGFATAAKMDINPIPTFLAYHTVFQALQFIATGAAIGIIFGDLGREPEEIVEAIAT